MRLDLSGTTEVAMMAMFVYHTISLCVCFGTIIFFKQTTTIPKQNAFCFSPRRFKKKRNGQLCIFHHRKMKTHTCKFCNYQTKDQSNYKRHLTRCKVKKKEEAKRAIMALQMKIEQLQEQLQHKDRIIKQILDKIQKKKRKSANIPMSLRRKVWDTYIGKEHAQGNCYVCGCEITCYTWQCGHIISKHDGGLNSLDNLMPICGLCNRSMGTRNMEEFKNEYFSENK